MEEQTTIIRSVEAEHGSIVSYSVGFGLSVLFTLSAFALASKHVLTGQRLMALLMGLAIIQFAVQLIFFLHIGRESKPRWRQLLLLLMVFFVLVLVLGSIWVMYSLNYRMSPKQINSYMMNQSQSGL